MGGIWAYGNMGFFKSTEIKINLHVIPFCPILSKYVQIEFIVYLVFINIVQSLMFITQTESLKCYIC